MTHRSKVSPDPSCEMALYSDSHAKHTHTVEVWQRATFPVISFTYTSLQFLQILPELVAMETGVCPRPAYQVYVCNLLFFFSLSLLFSCVVSFFFSFSPSCQS